MPGLIRGVARTAVVAGTATAVSNRVSRRQVNRWSARGEMPGQPQEAQPDPYQQAPPPAPAPAAPPADPVHELRELAKLRDDGILTEEEFAAEKRKILG